MDVQQLHVVVGAGGVTGRLVVGHLLAAGCRVRALTRDGRPVGSPSAELRAVDAADPVALSEAVRGAAAIHHCAMPPIGRWLNDFPALTDSIIDAASASGARVVYADDTWMYGQVSGPMTAELPYRPVGRLGVLRAWLAERLSHAAAAGRIRLSIVRAGELYGPRVRSMIAGNVFGNVHRGRTARWFGDPDLPITPTYVDDFARTLAAVGQHDAGTGRVWHVPHPRPTTGRALIALAATQVGRRARVATTSRRQLRAVGALLPLARDGVELIYQFEQPFIVDGSATSDAFGVTATRYAEGVRAALASYSE